jgi:hypothetical protein
MRAFHEPPRELLTLDRKDLRVLGEIQPVPINTSAIPANRRLSSVYLNRPLGGSRRSAYVV